jgi:outer membrane protein
MVSTDCNLFFLKDIRTFQLQRSFNIMKKTMLAAAALLALSNAWATEESPWSWRIGVTRITPHINSGDLTPAPVSGIKTDVGADSELSGGINYRFDNRWAVDVPLGLPFTQKTYGAGIAKRKGQIGSFKSVPATALLQYSLTDRSTDFRPYVGAGITYAKFFGEMPTAGNPDFAIKSKYAPSLQLGAQWKLNEAWSLDVNYIQTYLETTTYIPMTSFGTSGEQNASVNPSALSIGFVHAF